MATTFTINHDHGRYPVVVGAGVLADWREYVPAGHATAVISDVNVAPLHAARLGAVDCTVTLPAGEEHKILATVATIYDALLAARLDRQTTILALGGGVVGDMAGFAAATYLRGVSLLQCPTSLLAMVDASIGGKTGVDLPQGKNLVGAFKQPTAVLADLDTLATLPPPDFRAGLAEIVKAGLIGDPALFARLEDTAPPDARTRDLIDIVAAAVDVKRRIVEADPYEKGRRAWLNLGHTFAHAIERETQYDIRHGEAVAIGLVIAARLSAWAGHCSPSLSWRIAALLEHLGLPVRLPPHLVPERLLAATVSDKKRAAGRPRYILLRDVGEVFIADVPDDIVLAVLAAS